MGARRLAQDGRARALLALTLSLAAAASFVALIVWAIEPAHRQYLLYYYVPVVVPFVAYGVERALDWRSLNAAQWLIELVVITLALVRAFVALPFVSGHALFLSYALVAVPSPVVRVTSALVLLEVIYLKLFVWQDESLWGGMLLGVIAALAFRRARQFHESRSERYV